MIKFRLSVIILLVHFAIGDQNKCGFVSNSVRDAPTIEDFEFENEETRLLGSHRSTPHHWPWVVELTYNGKHKCGGVLIDEQIVLTAAHCFKDRSPERFKILTGGFVAGTGQVHNVQKVSIHSLYEFLWPQAYDVALVKFFPPITINNETSTICLPRFNAPDRQICVVAGWGVLGETGRMAQTLREIHIPIMPFFECNDDKHYHGRVHMLSMICAGYNWGKIDACQGDSGGPLMCAIDGRWEVHGVVSWGIGCGRAEYPGVYANVNAANPWIALEMASLKFS